MQRITPCLWFDDRIEEAVNFYVSIFKNSKITQVTHYAETAGEFAGKVLTITFQLDGQEFMALNGGPAFHFTEAISLMVNCEDQQELDAMWDKLSEGGEEVQCSWLKDKYGLFWQIVPVILVEMMSDPAKWEKVHAAVMTMVKLDIAKLQEAYNS
jgi:predicted 3-demethylubiquinone-9 3-methyltransferase (glyoxalase superfamily)